MKTIKKAVGILLSILLWGVILLTALFTFTTLATRSDQSVARVAGYTPLMVQTQSMSPTFNAGDLIVIKACNPHTLRVGDIITFHTIINNEYALNTHRIESIDEEGGYRQYVTKGDNNDIVDTHIIQDSDIVGKYVLKASGLGKVMTFLSSSAGFLIVIVLPMLLFFIYQVYHLVMVSINLKKAIAVEEAEQKVQKEQEAEQKLAEAEAALAEARRLKEEMEAALAQVNGKTANKQSKSSAAVNGQPESGQTEIPAAADALGESAQPADMQKKDV